MMKPGDGETRYFLLFLDIADFQSFLHFYGGTEGKRLLLEAEEEFCKLPGVLLCRRIYSDCYLCLYRAETDVSAGISERVGVLLNGALARQKERYPKSRLGLTCGICRISDGDAESAVEGANLARREAKRQGSLRPVLFTDELREQSEMLFEMEEDSNRALREGRFCFYLQPEIDLLTGKIVGAEALVRGIDTDGNVVSPFQFLSVMERTGTIVELDVLICRKVCEFLSDRLKRGLTAVKTSVNLSGLHARQPETADLLHAAAQDYGIPAELLEFEISERTLQDDFSEVKQFIDRLRGFGYRVCIDNFGAGFAGINLWQELNFDAIKLDRKFLSEEEALRERNEALVPNIINIADRLRIDVICEGVETEKQCGYLIRLGCTTGQGYCFACPAPPESFYRSCERLEGGFDVSSWRADLPVREETAGEKMPGRMKTAFSRAVKSYAFIGSVCALFLAVCITGIFVFYRETTTREFAEMTVENLNAYARGQKENTVSYFESIKDTLEALAVMISRKNDQAFVNGYLLALNEDSPDLRFIYTTAEYFQENMNDEATREEDFQILEQLKNKHDIVSGVIYSERMGGIYCVAVGVPVFRNDKFIGALRCIINAEKLVEADMFPASQGQVTSSFLVDSKGNVVPVRGNGENLHTNLFEEMRVDGIGNEIVSQLADAVASGRTDSVYAGIFGGAPVYVSVMDLGYNDWHLVLAIRADMAADHSRTIIRRTLQGAVVLILCTLLACGIYFWLMARLLKRLSAGEQRYRLIEQFADTVLFDYDRRRDTIHFTPNASLLFRVGKLVQEKTMESMEDRNVYAGDADVMRRMLDGQHTEDTGEVRVRLLHPAEDRYFWVLIQFRYIRHRGQVTSVVGKITDIDKQKSHEDMLQKISETDGLTGLRNKTAAEGAIQKCLEEGHQGMLFMLDLDNFKKINDAYGHAAGDMALKYVADCMRGIFRAEDILGRIGGDEMVIFAAKMSDVHLAGQKAEQLMKLIRAGEKEGLPPLSVSIGISRCPEDGDSYEQLYKSADDAMYNAKADGKGEYCFSTADDKEGMRRENGI